MKNVFKYLMAVLACVLVSTAFVACEEDDEFGSADLGLGIKVFSPTHVVAGLPMTINGSGFGEATEIEFPGGVKVTSFEVVTNEMMRLIAPAGISADGGKIIVRNSKGESAESRLALTVGKTVVSGFSKQPGEELKGLEEITVYGQDLQFIEKAELLDEEGNPLIVSQKDFTRLAQTKAVVKIPNNIFTGTFVGKLWTFDGQCIEMPELAYEPTVTGGHWEITKKYLWKNGEHSTIPAPSWSGEGRFCSVSHVSGEETYAFSEEEWELLKTQPFRIEIEKLADWVNLRVTTGWWSTNYMGLESLNDLVQEDEEGNFFVEMNLQEDPALLAVIDEQHLLFTGQDYKLLGIYVLEQEWVGGGGHMEKVRKTFWKNGEHSTIPAPSWSGEGRFCSVSHVSGEETYAFSEEEWEILKTQPFRIQIEKLADWVNLRVTTGWWSTNYMGLESLNDLVQEDEDGNFFVEINLQDDPALLAVVDEQHLLFTGQDYKLLEIYQETEEWVGGGDEGPSETVIWENDGSLGAINWDGAYRFSSEEASTGEECYAIPMDQWDVIKNGTFYLVAKGSDWVQMRITTGWWSTTWTGNDITTGDDRIIDLGDGTYEIEINFAGDPILDVLDEQHLLFTGGGYTPLKLYHK